MCVYKIDISFYYRDPNLPYSLQDLLGMYDAGVPSINTDVSGAASGSGSAGTVAIGIR